MREIKGPQVGRENGEERREKRRGQRAKRRGSEAIGGSICNAEVTIRIPAYGGREDHSEAAVTVR